ncbi:MAG TPA: hypothetical protein ENN46_02085 [Candidatus Woesearchaeota archaeon]|nr:hypothetical protein [Candidatus Woesearchaeota archaeon]
MKNPARAQAAMEFMITYGWILFIGVAIIAVIATFTNLDALAFRAQKCEIYSSFKCLSFALDSNGELQVIVGNSAQDELTITSASLILDSGTVTAGSGSIPSTSLKRGTGANSRGTITFNNVGRKVDGKIEITYYFGNADASTHTAVGYIYTRR